MIYIESDSLDPYYNLALEEFVFERTVPSVSCFMLWQNHRTVVIGKNQNTMEEINLDYVTRHEIKVVRRLSGGGAVYHDRGNLNYTFIEDRRRHESFGFRQFVIPVIRTLAEYGVHAEFSGRNDIVIDGRKCSGSAQYVRKGKILHHGCIMLNTDVSVLTEALAGSGAKYESNGVKSVRSRVTTVSEHTGRPVVVKQFADSLRRNAVMESPLVSYSLTRAEQDEVRRLAETKYRTWEWNFGQSPACSVKKERRYPFGTVSALMSVEEGAIKAIRIYGDFFGEKEIGELEQYLSGFRLGPGFAEMLEGVPVGDYIRGMGPGELGELLLSD